MVVKRKVRQDRIALDVDPDCQAHTHTNNENSTSCRKCDSSATFCQDKLCDADGIMHEMQQMHGSQEWAQALAKYVLQGSLDWIHVTDQT